MSKDAAGFTPQERHDIIVGYLKEINKPTKVFHLRWKPGDKLDSKVLSSTPMFWYMKYHWGRAEIEGLFFKARIVIGPLFDKALTQTFGGDPGPRWRGAIPDTTAKKWKQRQYEKTKPWKGAQTQKLKTPAEEEAERLAAQKLAAEKERQNKLQMENKLANKSKDIWNAVSDFGADKSIDYKTFSDNLRDRGINVSPLLAKQLFDQLAGPSGKISKQEMEELMKKLDAMNVSSNVTWDMLGDKLGCMTIMKRVLLAAGAGEPFNVDDFVFMSKFGVNIGAIAFLGKLSDRDVPWDDRVRAMENIAANIGTNPMYNGLLASANIPELLCGFAAQMLDNKPEVQKTAIDLLPNVFHNAIENGDPNIAVGHLEEILDNLFKVLDDPNARKNHPAAKDAVDKLVQDIINTKDPESVLFLSGLLAEKCDIENVNSPEARKFALEELQKLMFGQDSPYIKFDKAANEAPIVSENKLPKKGTANREWLDIGTNNLAGPTQDPQSYNDEEDGNQKGRTYPDNQLRDEHEYKERMGVGDDESFGSDPAAPYANVESSPPDAKPKEPVTVDATKSHDCDGDPCKSYLFDFGDDSEPVKSNKPVVQHSYDYPGTYPVTVQVTDKYGKTGEADLTQKVIDPDRPNKMGPPYAQLTSDPSESKTGQVVWFDATKCHDYKGNPCEHFVFDFGDASKMHHAKVPKISHRFDKPGVYECSVTATDKVGMTAKAGLQQRVVDPDAQDPTKPYANVRSEPTNAKPKEPVTFDASKSRDCEGDKVKNFVFDFGDGTKPVKAWKPVMEHKYEKPGTYPVTVTVTDKFGKTSTASLAQRVKDPKNPKKKTPPYAAVDSSPPEADIDEPVTFDASKSHDMNGDPCDNFVFDFGDGSPPKKSKTPIVQHPYKQAGSYPVKVLVTDKDGLTSPASCNQRVAPPPPKNGPDDPYVAVESTPPNPKPKEPVTFDASKSKDMDGDPCKNYTFDFGDGSPVVHTPKPVVQHKYDEPGVYPVTVTAVDKYGKQGNAKLMQRVTDPMNPNKPSPPHAQIASNPPESVPKQPVTFDASKSHDQFKKPCKQFEFDFGDGTPPQISKSPKVQHPYSNPGTYPVKVVVTDNNGLSSQAGLNQRVKNPPGPQAEDPYASVRSEPTNADPKEPVTIDASKSVDQDGDPCKTFTVDFGDGSPPVTTNNPVVNHCYDQPGTYPVTCTVTDKYGRKGQANLTQRVKDPKDPTKKSPPYAAVDSTPPEAVPRQPVFFDASKSHDSDGDPCKKFVWDFGDKTPKVTTFEPRTQHAFNKVGTYPVEVTVTDKNGLESPAKLNQRIRPINPEDPYAAVESTPKDPKPQEPVRFDASKSVDKDGDPVKSYVFDFGDGSPPLRTSDPVANHVYEEPGTYPVNVTAVDKDGNKGSAHLNQKVVDPDDKKDDRNPPFANVISSPPEANIGQPVCLDASKSHDQDGDPCKEFVWDFGDGTNKVKTDTPTTKHKYKKPGVFPVTVEVKDKEGLKSTAGLNQRVREPGPEDPYANVSSTPPDAKRKEPVTFDASKSKDQDGDPCKKFVFDFGDGTPPVESDKPVVKHAYDEPGVFPVNCVVTDKYGNKGNASLEQRITDPNDDKKEDSPPYAHVESTPPDAKPREPVTVDASKSKDQDGDPCKKFVFDFGDGTRPVTSKKPVVKHSYNKPGVFPVTVEVTDKNGLVSDASLQQRVTDPNMNDDSPNKGNKGPKKKNYGGRKGKGNDDPDDYDGKFGDKKRNNKDPFGPSGGSNDQAPYDEMKNEPPMDSEEIGDEFRNITQDAISKAIMDPNQRNNKDAKKLADVMRQLNPSFPDQLDPEAKKQFDRWKRGPMKKMMPMKPPPKRKLPGYKAGTKAVHQVKSEVIMNVTAPVMPDI